MPSQHQSTAKVQVAFGSATSIVKGTKIQYSDVKTLDGGTLITVTIQMTQESSAIELALLFLLLLLLLLLLSSLF